MNKSFQKCVKGIFSENGWGRKRLLPIVFIKLEWKEKRKTFHYAPRYSEIMAWLKLMINVMGKKEVEKELNIKLGDAYNVT